ncbi:MAG: hypothetical protein K2J63_05990 [Muribaculaceae bacterium]|nr:hypothetical protein [Muribaculaceae bacterium]MDE6794840.1 hypothetical protein [Muribaculaceae bacterium]
MDKNSSKDKRYIEIFLSPLRECLNYKPKFGHASSTGFTLEQFMDLYRQDPFYNWIGLDSPYMFAAHKAAGGMTSIYRQIGIGCERLFRAILVDSLGYTSEEDALWSYSAKTKARKEKTLYLDGFIDMEKILNDDIRNRVNLWMKDFSRHHRLTRKEFIGIVFEIRQGYKSKDSKRQNADIDNATVAYANDLIPVFAVFSTQIDEDIVLRYSNNKCGILIGTLSNDPFVSIFAFCQEILNFDLADFFRRNTIQIKNDTQNILKALLSV